MNESNHNNNRRRTHNKSNNRYQKYNNGPRKNEVGTSGERNNRRPNNKNRRPPNNRGNGNRDNRDNRDLRNNKNKNPLKAKLSPNEYAFYKYQELNDAHIAARAKYFEVFDRTDVNLKNKWERLFDQTLKKLRDYEASLKDEARAYITQKIDGLTPDRTYTENHELPVDGELEIAENEIQDPHLLVSQINIKANANYSNDTEESVGTYEDYKNYKGL